MTEHSKITASHLTRQAIVYLRQSSPSQVEHNRESTARQYALAIKARELGWSDDRIILIDEDLGLSGSGTVVRSGFARLTAEVALGHVGIVLGLEVSRLARNNADWYRLIDLAGISDTLIGDADGIYHPGLFNDRLLLGLKGTMSEAELHVLRARLNGGIRNKAASGSSSANSGAACQSALFGVTPMAKSVSTKTKLSSPPFAASSPNLRRPARRAGSGSGSVLKACRFRCRCTRVTTSAGSMRATPLFTTC